MVVVTNNRGSGALPRQLALEVCFPESIIPSLDQFLTMRHVLRVSAF